MRRFPIAINKSASVFLMLGVMLGLCITLRWQAFFSSIYTNLYGLNAVYLNAEDSIARENNSSYQLSEEFQFVHPRIQAKYLESLGKFEQAIGILNENGMEVNKLVHWNLVRLYIRLNELEKAQSHLKSLNLSQDNLVMLGNTYWQSQNFGILHIFLEEASSKDGGSWVTNRTLGLWWMNEARWDLAEIHLLEGVNMQQLDGYSMYLLGITYRNQNRLDKSIDMFEKAIVLYPDSLDYQREYAKTLLLRNHVGDRNKALGILYKIIEQDSTDQETLDLIMDLEEKPN